MATPCEHHHGAGTSASEQNKEFFNKEAAHYDTKHEKTINKLIEEIRAKLDFIGVDWVEDDEDTEGNGEKTNEGAQEKTVRLLDYACGTGVVSRALAPYTTQCVGIDLSENMATAYNARAENQGLTHSEMHAYQGNLCDPEDPNPQAFASPEFSNFDVAAVGLGFHHFDDPALAAKRLAGRLKTGGVLVILDFFSHDKPDPSHPATNTITHHGFSEEQVRRIFEDAGVGKDFAMGDVGAVFHFSREDGSEVRRKLFIARGTKA
ncbi:S-adenosyl-L-methionine-dependent methyltransferase [Achaetomium macrosporum]|uniref:S-adenosyl-L-methionine-dependent methyltransferase n=1 Tax=Achaetomium macrosporum TaxID=79813 RepID=A0AAN7HD21_9PEZI|nr:S-adenosyl-L-methionine-dependent methyltransferase [Achaetomium macrosporum]